MTNPKCNFQITNFALQHYRTKVFKSFSRNLCLFRRRPASGVSHFHNQLCLRWSAAQNAEWRIMRGARRGNWKKDFPRNGLDTRISVPVAFKLDHLQPFVPILFWSFSNIFTFILGSQGLWIYWWSEESNDISQKIVSIEWKTMLHYLFSDIYLVVIRKSIK